MCTTDTENEVLSPKTIPAFFTSCMRDMLLAGITASRNVNSIACAYFETRCSTEKQCSVYYVS